MIPWYEHGPYMIFYSFYFQYGRPPLFIAYSFTFTYGLTFKWVHNPCHKTLPLFHPHHTYTQWRFYSITLLGRTLIINSTINSDSYAGTLVDPHLPFFCFVHVSVGPTSCHLLFSPRLVQPFSTWKKKNEGYMVRWTLYRFIFYVPFSFRPSPLKTILLQYKQVH